MIRPGASSRRNRDLCLEPSLSRAAEPRQQRRVPAVFCYLRVRQWRRQDGQFQFCQQEQIHGQPKQYFQPLEFLQFQFQDFHQPYFYLIQKRRFMFFEFQQFRKFKLFQQNRQFQFLESYLIRKRQCQF